MLWEIEILPLGHDSEAERVRSEFTLLQGGPAPDVRRASRGFLLEGDFPEERAELLFRELLLDALVETGRLGPLNAFASLAHEGQDLRPIATVLLKPGVMDPVADSVLLAARDLGVPLTSVRTLRRYYSAESLSPAARDVLCRRVLANEAIEQVIDGPLHLDHLTLGADYQFRLGVVALRGVDDAGLMQISKQGQLSHSLAEMKTIQAHFAAQGRDPTDVELETLAQTWSEHCSHKTLKGRIDFEGRHYENLLKETIFGATQEIRKRLGADDWCVSVFEDNAGVVKFTDDLNVCFKVETHNHPSAIEPYGGANTGLGGVIRDPLGTGMGGPGYRFEDEFQSGKTFDKEGLLAMANSGPNTNGSQFFIVTADEAPWLDGKHTVFGQVAEGEDVVDRLDNTPTGGADRPLTPVLISSIELGE